LDKTLIDEQMILRLLNRRYARKKRDTASWGRTLPGGLCL